MLNLDLAFMRNDIQQFFPDTVVIQTVAFSYDDYGTRIEVYTPLATLSGQLSNPTGNEQRVVSSLVAAGLIKTQAFTLTLPFGTAITTDNVVTVNSVTFDVVHVNTPMTLIAATVALITRRDIATIQDDSP